MCSLRSQILALMVPPNVSFVVLVAEGHNSATKDCAFVANVVLTWNLLIALLVPQMITLQKPATGYHQPFHSPC